MIQYREIFYELSAITKDLGRVCCVDQYDRDLIERLRLAARSLATRVFDRLPEDHAPFAAPATAVLDAVPPSVQRCLRALRDAVPSGMDATFIISKPWS